MSPVKTIIRVDSLPEWALRAGCTLGVHDDVYDPVFHIMHVGRDEFGVFSEERIVVDGEDINEYFEYWRGDKFLISRAQKGERK